MQGDSEVTLICIVLRMFGQVHRTVLLELGRGDSRPQLYYVHRKPWLGRSRGTYYALKVICIISIINIITMMTDDDTTAIISN